MKHYPSLLLFLLAMATTHQTNAQDQILSPELLWKVGRVALDAVSPDGRWAVYGVTRFDVQANKSARALYLVEVQSGQTRLLTDPEKISSDAAFRPDGERIGFLRDGKLYEIPVDGPGEAAKVSDQEMNGFQYAPNGRFVLFVQDVKLDKTLQELNPDLAKSSGRAFDGLFYRHWKSWHDYAYSNVFYAAYQNGKLTSTPVNIQNNERFDSPLTPDGGMEQISWSPDARWIIYTCRKLNGTAEAQSTNSDLYAYELASGKTLNFTADLVGYDRDPVWSPDGRYLIWTSLQRPGYEADRPRLMILDTQTQMREELSANWTYEMNHPVWAPDSRSIYFLSSENFTYQIYQISLTDKKIKRLTNGTHDYTALKVAGNDLVTTRISMVNPPEVYVVNPKTGDARRLSFATDDVWNTLAKPKVERRTVKTFDGKDMNVWLILPPNFDPNKKYPALVYAQGGPQSPLSQSFSFRWNFSLMASQGYVVVAPCRRGMPGSGQAWNDAITGKWGDAMKDYLSATDAAAKEPFIDASRMGAIGASFGGYAVYWLAGNHQKRFKAFISHCGLFNLESFYGTTEEVWFPHYDFEGAYWQTPIPKMYQTDSPHRFVQNWDTPIMVIHNELDFRVPFGEGMQAFQAAQLRGIPSRFLSFPDEGHWMSKPQNSLLWQREFYTWLDKWLK
ncbi:MAG: S9 family peptidase [Saprospiraceae bacterium]|nr:S9 family peptidase [Saprospiraceae bacterium]